PPPVAPSVPAAIGHEVVAAVAADGPSHQLQQRLDGLAHAIEEVGQRLQLYVQSQDFELVRQQVDRLSTEVERTTTETDRLSTGFAPLEQRVLDLAERLGALARARSKGSSGALLVA